WFKITAALSLSRCAGYTRREKLAVKLLVDIKWRFHESLVLRVGRWRAVNLGERWSKSDVVGNFKCERCLAISFPARLSAWLVNQALYRQSLARYVSQTKKGRRNQGFSTAISHIFKRWLLAVNESPTGKTKRAGMGLVRRDAPRLRPE